MAKNIINQWDQDFINRSPIFADLQLLLKKTHWSNWPACQGLLALLETPIVLSSGLLLDMKPQDQTLPFPQMGYEERVYKKGIISTREKNWHDLFNAFIWLLFPKTKVLLNELHIQELTSQVGKKRTPARDAITHLDESGIIIVSHKKSVFTALYEHQWQSLFIHSRKDWFSPQQQIGAFVFGHGMYEKALNPFVGFTGKAYCLEVDENFFQQDKTTQYQCLDQLLCNDIKQKKSLNNSRSLSPLPILGVPGWSKDNENINFYDNHHYFRAKKKKLN
jgi:hypothetical protein